MSPRHVGSEFLLYCAATSTASLLSGRPFTLTPGSATDLNSLATTTAIGQHLPERSSTQLLALLLSTTRKEGISLPTQCVPGSTLAIRIPNSSLGFLNITTTKRHTKRTFGDRSINYTEPVGTPFWTLTTLWRPASPITTISSMLFTKSK